MKTKKTAFGLLWGESWGNAQSLRQSCSHETPAGRFGSCGTRLVGTVVKAAHVVIGGTE